MYNMKKTLYLAVLSALLFSAVGCSGNDTPEVDSGEVTLLTRAGSETSDFRLLVFDNNEGKCLFNQAFGPGNESVRLATGTYRFVTLSGTESLDLPAAGTTDGIDLSKPIALKAGGSSPVQIGTSQEVSIPETTVYEVDLKPATCLLKLETTGAPADMVFTLKNMYAGISLSGSNVGNLPATTHVLQSGPNICLPTAENTCLAYQSKEGNGTFDLGIKLEAGYTYQATLQWHNASLSVTSRIEKWVSNPDIPGDAE